MEKNLPFLTLRVLIVIFISAFVVAKGRIFLADMFGLSINPQLYLGIGFVIFIVVFQFAMRGPLKELRRRRDAEEKKMHPSSTELIASDAPRGGFVHKVPIRVTVGMAGLGIILILGYLLGEKPIPPSGYAVILGLAAGTFLIVLHMCRYSVIATTDAIRITGLIKTRLIPRSEIKIVRVATSKGGKKLVVTLRDESKIVIWSLVTNFDSLISDVIPQ